MAKWITQADGLLICAGAGMGVDSGLPDFRSEQGFWRAYPALGALGLSFYDIARPSAFVQDAARAWGFYGHRLALYRQTQRLDAWRAGVKAPLIVELGAGVDIPTVRMFSESIGKHARLVRINPRAPEIPSGVKDVSIASGALGALTAIERELDLFVR